MNVNRVDPVVVAESLGLSRFPGSSRSFQRPPGYANHQSSLNRHQMFIGEEGIQRWVVAHRDPGVQNWIDTTGLPRGYLSHRWAYSVLPPKEDWPTISCRVISFDEIQRAMPEDQPRVTSAERREIIRIRQRHVQKRFRVF